MRIRRLLAAALIAACAAGALGGCAVGLSHLIWHRSLRATVYERMLAKRFATTRTAQEETERLEKMRAEAEMAYALPEGAAEGLRVERGEHDGMAWFELNGDGDGGVTILYLHGGAFINRFNAYHWRLMAELARQTGAVIIAPDYHVAPHGNCARAYRDLPAFYLECRKAHPGRVILMGDSAGGGLALGLAEYFAREGLPQPERLILLSPWVDLSMDNPDIADYAPVDPVLHLELVKVHGRFWADGLDVHDWRVSPLYGDLRGLPPVTLYTGTRELLYPDLVILNGKLAAAGVDVGFRVGRGLNHEYPLMPIPEAKRAIRDIAALIRGQRGLP